MILANDPEVRQWAYGILHGEPEPSGSFLMHLAEAVVRADDDNYALLRDGIHAIMRRFPKYKCKLYEECIATGANHSFGPYGPNREIQCRYCGEPEFPWHSVYVRKGE